MSRVPGPGSQAFPSCKESMSVVSVTQPCALAPPVSAPPILEPRSGRLPARFSSEVKMKTSSTEESDDQNCALETYIISLTNVTPIRSVLKVST